LRLIYTGAQKQGTSWLRESWDILLQDGWLMTMVIKERKKRCSPTLKFKLQGVVQAAQDQNKVELYQSNKGKEKNTKKI
jgi:hypothetical protein